MDIRGHHLAQVVDPHRADASGPGNGSSTTRSGGLVWSAARPARRASAAAGPRATARASCPTGLRTPATNSAKSTLTSLPNRSSSLSPGRSSRPAWACRQNSSRGRRPTAATHLNHHPRDKSTTLGYQTFGLPGKPRPHQHFRRAVDPCRLCGDQPQFDPLRAHLLGKRHEFRHLSRKGAPSLDGILDRCPPERSSRSRRAAADTLAVGNRQPTLIRRAGSAA